MKVGMVLKHGDRLEKQLKKLDRKVAEKILVKATKAAAAPVKKAARARISAAGLKDSAGLLRLSIGDKTRKSKRRPLAYSVIGPRSSFRGRKVTAIREAGGKAVKRRDPVNYAHLVEFGTSAHWIRAKKQGYLAFAGVVTKAVKHPGAQPRPFMRPAFEASKRLALAKMISSIRSGLRREAAKLGGAT